MKDIEERLSKIERTIDILKHTLKELILTQNNSDLTTTKSTNSDLVPKDRILIQSLLERSKDSFHTKFLSNILNSKYDTLTQKQYQVLVNIQNTI